MAAVAAWHEGYECFTVRSPVLIKWLLGSALEAEACCLLLGTLVESAPLNLQRWLPWITCLNVAFVRPYQTFMTSRSFVFPVVRAVETQGP